MLIPYSSPERPVTQYAERAAMSTISRKLWFETSPKRFALGTSIAVGAVSFFAAELMHYLLVSDLGGRRERLLAEGLSALIVCCLVGTLAHVAFHRHLVTKARLQVAGEMNHHIRNAMTSIWLSVQITENRQLIRVVSEGVDRIDWALREILPREVPLNADQRSRRWRPERDKEKTPGRAEPSLG
jgi:hypothetical protein